MNAEKPKPTLKTSRRRMQVLLTNSEGPTAQLETNRQLQAELVEQGHFETLEFLHILIGKGVFVG